MWEGVTVNVVSFSLSWCSTGGPEVQSAGCWLSLLNLISNFSGPQTPSGFPRAPSVGCGFPYHISSITPSDLQLELELELPTSVLTELYDSSTPTRSPTRSLKSHVWSSSSGNNCHAVHRSLSSGASVYECTMGIFFSSSHFISQFPLTRFPLITVIRMCHFLPVHYLEWHFGRVEGQNITLFLKIQFSISHLFVTQFKLLSVLFDPLTGPYLVLPLWVREDLGAMAMKGYSTFPKASRLDPHYQIV